jgi:hypothetical protein
MLSKIVFAIKPSLLVALPNFIILREMLCSMLELTKQSIAEIARVGLSLFLQKFYKMRNVSTRLTLASQMLCAYMSLSIVIVFELEGTKVAFVFS